jgi:hypothetical protein
MSLDPPSVAARVRGDRVPGWAPMISVSVVLVSFIAATNRWLDWDNSLNLLSARDEFDYRAIATAAPHLPSRQLQNQHAQRFAFHYLIGLIARAVGTNVDHVYLVVTLVTVIAVVGVLMRVLRTIELSSRAAVLCLAVFILNTYSIRYYLIARGEVADLLLDLGVLVSLSGLFARRYRLILLGTAIGAAARQTELPAALALGIAVFLWPGSAELPVGSRLLRAALPALVALVIYVIEIHVAASFSYDYTPPLKRFSVLGDLTALPSGAGALAQHIVRSLNGLFAAGALVVVGLLAGPAQRRWRAPGIEFWACLLIALAVALQPLVLNAAYADHNETRLSVLGLGALVCALAVLLRRLERDGRSLPPGVVRGLVVVLAAGSFHHLYTIIGTANATQTVVLQLVVAAVAAAGLRAGLRPQNSRSGSGSGSGSGGQRS